MSNEWSLLPPRVHPHQFINQSASDGGGWAGTISLPFELDLFGSLGGRYSYRSHCSAFVCGCWLSLTQLFPTIGFMINDPWHESACSFLLPVFCNAMDPFGWSLVSTVCSGRSKIRFDYNRSRSVLPDNRLVAFTHRNSIGYAYWSLGALFYSYLPTFRLFSTYLESELSS